jgi:hypothetical protein
MRTIEVDTMDTKYQCKYCGNEFIVFKSYKQNKIFIINTYRRLTYDEQYQIMLNDIWEG